MKGVLASDLAEKIFAGRWSVVRSLRTGGMGAVYEVVHRETQARCALKVMLPELGSSDELRARFRQEAMVTARIESDHIVKVLDAGTDMETGAPYLVMELLRGEDLGTRIATRGPIPAAETVVLLVQVALALEKTHAAGIVHRDLKPENLFVVARDDGSPCVKVLDFGIAKVIASASKAETTRALGTPLYMAPEQVRGEGTIDSAADLYALGQIAFTMLTGSAYWAEERKEHGSVYPLLMAITAGTSEPASVRSRRLSVELPEGFDAWFARATHADPTARFRGASAMIEALAEVLGEEAHPRSGRSSGPAALAQGLPPPGGAGPSRSGAPRARRSWWVAPPIALATLGFGIGAISLGGEPTSALPSAASVQPDAAPQAVVHRTEPPPVDVSASATGTPPATPPAAPASPPEGAHSARPVAPAVRSAPASPSARRSQPQPTASVASPRRPVDPSDEYEGERR